MNVFSKYWKALLAALLVAAAAFLYLNVYATEKRAYEYDKELLNTSIMVLQKNIADNRPYEGVQEQISEEREKLAASRLSLYNSLPVDVKEEDQIMYVLYLESVFGTEIGFEFSDPTPILNLNDSSVLKSVDLIVNYRSTYKGFQEMINYLAQDYRVVSVDKANIKYYPKQDLAVGYVKIKLYLLDTSASVFEEIKELRKYSAPVDKIVNVPNTGKDNIFANIYDQPSRTYPYENFPAYPDRDEMNAGQYELDAKIWVTQHDMKYHSRYACGYMYSPVEMVFSQVLAAGIQPCEKCFASSGATDLESTAENEKSYAPDSTASEIHTVEKRRASNHGGSGMMVWITETGSKYHSKRDCGNTQNATQVSIEQAQKLYSACENCF